MGKKLIITEKPSVARDFARVLNVKGKGEGFIENDELKLEVYKAKEYKSCKHVFIRRADA